MATQQTAQRKSTPPASARDVTHETVSLMLDAQAEDVYAFIAKPENLPHWAPNLCEATTKLGDQWLLQTPAGPVKFCFTEPDTFGVLDHRLTLASGEEIFVAMCVSTQAKGSEISITVPRDPALSEQQFAQDLQRVEQDLYTLKCIVECLAAL